jgi:predicted nucleic acid-binding protein
LKTLYSHVLVPEAVAAVRAWIAQPPAWLEVRPNPPFDPALQFLDAGESAAIALGISIAAGGLLMDDWDGRSEGQSAPPTGDWHPRRSG